MLHHPIYPSHPWRDVPALRERFVPVFDKHHVDFVLQGHDHAYQRTYPMRGRERASSPADGTIYLTAVSGDKFVEGTERNYVAVGRAGVSTYQTFDIDAQSKRLTYRAWTEEGTVLDELLVVKAPGPGAPLTPALSSRAENPSPPGRGCP
jgi:acid phosphatase type 7